MNLNIVLFQPEIPQNTGNIGRTCVLTNCKLHLIKPLGFSLDEKAVRRAGLDYWPQLELEIHESYEALREKYKNGTFYFCTTKGTKYYNEPNFKEGDFLVFGRESKGLPDYIKVPMVDTTTRSLNLSNTVAIIAYEGLRQIGFKNMK